MSLAAVTPSPRSRPFRTTSARRAARLVLALLGTGAAAGCAAVDATGPGAAASAAPVYVQIKDAPLNLAEVKRVDLYIVRIEGRLAEADSAESARHTEDGERGVGGWTTLVEPMAAYDFMTLRDTSRASLGHLTLPPGTYRGFRLILDPTKSSVTTANGTVLTSTTTPSLRFSGSARLGVQITLARPLVVDSTAQNFLVDIDLSKSFRVPGRTVLERGLEFNPSASATNRAREANEPEHGDHGHDEHGHDNNGGEHTGGSGHG